MSESWHRIAPGAYDRVRHPPGGVPTLDQVFVVEQDDGEYWVFTIDSRGGDDLYRTRREATAALNAWIEETS